MSIKNTGQFPHTQHYYPETVQDLPTVSDIGDKSFIFVNGVKTPYIFSYTGWIPDTPLPVSLADDQLNISLNAEQINLNTDGLETLLTNINTVSGIKKIVDPLPIGDNNIGNVDVLTSALPNGASTSAKQDTIISHVDGVETSLTNIITNGVSVNNTPNVSVTSTVNPSNLDISLSTHKNDILGINSKTLTDLFNDLETIKNIDFGLGGNKKLSDIVTALSNVSVISNANPSNLDITLSALRDALTKTGENTSTLEDINSTISTLQSALTTTKKIDDLYTILNTIYANKTLSDVNTSIVNLEGSGNKTLTDIVTQLTTMANTKTLADIVTALSSVTISSSALPANASTSAKQDTIITHVDGVETKLDTTNTNLSDIKDLTGEVSATPTANTELGRLKSIEDKLDSLSTIVTNIKTTDGIKKITDNITINTIPAGDNNIGNVDIVTLPTLPPGINNIGDVDVVSSALPLGASTEATLASILAKLISAPSTEAKQDTMIGHVDGIETALTTLLAKDFATQTTLASILAKIITSPATEAKQDTLIAKDFATQTTLAAILSKIIESPATEAKLESVRALLAGTISTQSTGSLTPVKTVTILSGATGLSDIIDLEGYQLFGIQMPATWVTANITFQTSFDGTTFQDAYDDSGLEITLQALQGKNISVDINALKLAPWKYVKFRSGTSGTPVDQTATRILKIVAKV